LIFFPALNWFIFFSTGVIGLVLEVNASPGFGIEKVTYRDVAGKIIDYIERNAKRGNKKDKIGA